MKPNIRRLIPLAACLLLAALLAGGCAREAKTAATLTPTPTAAVTPTPAATPTPTPTATPTPSPAPTPNPEMQALQDENADCLLYVSIEGTAIDYPVMYAPSKYDENGGSKAEYYLYRAFDESYEYSGSIFLDSHNQLGDRNLYLWGHNMRDGSMFRALHRYGGRQQSAAEAKAFWEEHRFVTLKDLYTTRTYEIIASCHAVVDGNPEYLFWFRSGNTEEEFARYVDYVEKNRVFDTGLTAAWGDELITLVTCYASDTDDKMIVVAKLVPDAAD